ncbi:hypothetical protein BY996DRAFT_6510081 [Phakopsora pachyrhizi]|nr:hypothetical protein BY996DRAFT_6510081 [Phakopsora pachyrhizi]
MSKGFKGQLKNQAAAIIEDIHIRSWEREEETKWLKQSMAKQKWVGYWIASLGEIHITPEEYPRPYAAYWDGGCKAFVGRNIWDMVVSLNRNLYLHGGVEACCLLGIGNDWGRGLVPIVDSWAATLYVINNLINEVRGPEYGGKDGVELLKAMSTEDFCTTKPRARREGNIAFKVCQEGTRCTHTRHEENYWTPRGMPGLGLQTEMRELNRVLNREDIAPMKFGQSCGGMVPGRIVGRIGGLNRELQGEE